MIGRHGSTTGTYRDAVVLPSVELTYRAGHTVALPLVFRRRTDAQR
ncbi:MAG: hypothetical protein GX557_01170 [Chloroflexi bacterium]|nr:hypothetical protein [Chloroflexota bacterium]